MGYQKLIKSGNTLEYFVYERTPAIIEQRGHVLRGMGRNRQKPNDTQRLVRRQDNAYRAQVAFGRLCCSNFDGVEIPVYVTFTFRPTKEWEQPTIKQGYSLFHVFTVRLRQRYNSHIRYVAVPEFGKRSTQRLHFHALFWGLPLEEIEKERKTRDFRKVWKYGNVDVVITNNDVKVGYYLAKYLTKAYQDPRLFNSKSYVTSRNIRRSEIYTDFASLMLEYEFEPDIQLVRLTSYATKYLGLCDYKRYKLLEPLSQDLKNQNIKGIIPST